VIRQVLLDLPVGRRKVVTVLPGQYDYRIARPLPIRPVWAPDETPMGYTVAVADIYQPTGEYEYYLSPTGVSALEVWRVL